MSNIDRNPGYNEQLTIKLEDKDLIEVSNIFLASLEYNFNKFNNELDSNIKKLSKYGKDKNKTGYIFEPEKLSKKSPLTILNGSWGVGKTYFIENFLKLLIDDEKKEINSEKFKNMIIIDAWKFSNSNDHWFSFLEELAKKILASNDKYIKDDEIKKGFLKTMFKKLKISNITWSINLPLLSFGATHDSNNPKTSDKNQQQQEKTIDDIMKIFTNNTKPTIIFIDNLERLGSSSWDLLKVIMKFQEFPNFLIVLPMHVNRLKYNESNENNEYPIEKYIDINWYDLVPSYAQYFYNNLSKITNHLTKHKLSLALERIFNDAASYVKELSIREIDQVFRKNNIFEMDNYSDIFNAIQKIWPNDIHILDSWKYGI